MKFRNQIYCSVFCLVYHSYITIWCPKISKDRNHSGVGIRYHIWIFLMGPGNCGTDMILCLDDSHSFKLRMGVGSGTNNFDELLALWRLYGLQKKGMLSSFLFLATQRS